MIRKNIARLMLVASPHMPIILTVYGVESNEKDLIPRVAICLIPPVVRSFAAIIRKIPYRDKNISTLKRGD